MSKNDLSVKLDTLNAIKNDDVRSPNSIPVDVYLQEAENLHHWATKDLEALLSAGLEQNYVTDLPVRAGALREAESRWITTRFAHEEAEKEWLEKSPAAYDLRNDLLKTFRFAFRKAPDLLGRVSAIAEGYGHADMIQDLNDLSVLGKANTDLLTAIKFNLVIPWRLYFIDQGCDFSS